ncbi:MAG: DegQ family serine endoprotease [Pseudomonadota bacterium]
MNITQGYISRVMLAVVFAGTFSGAASISSAQEIVDTERPGVAAMLEEVTPSVVNIAVTGTAAVPQNPLFNDPYFRRFFDAPEQPQTQQTMSVGSGVIIDAAKGYVLTNHHVVENADKIEITLHDKRQLEAKLIGSDAGTDIALLQVDAANLDAIPQSDSGTLKVGDFVAAIGNPFGLGQTVTTGIVSALGRSGISAEGYEDFIQTDASINPGNSGGALVDYNGNLIGINSAIISPGGGNVGIGFAVPINMAKSVINQLVEFGEVRRGLLGVMIQDFTPDVAEALQLDLDGGAVVSRVEPNSPAAKAGIEAGDVIVAVNSEDISSSSDLRNTIGLIRAGSSVEIDLMRGNRKMTVDAELGSGNQVETAAAGAPGSGVLDGAELGSIPRDNPAYGNTSGVLVVSVEQGSRAWNNGLRSNDIITAVNRNEVDSAESVEEMIAANTGALALSILREGQTQFMIVR